MDKTIVISVIGIVLTLVVNVFFSARKIGQLETTIATLVTNVGTITTNLNANTLTTNEIKVGVFGVMGNNGIRGEVKELKEDFKEFRILKHEVKNLRQVLESLPDTE